MLIQVTLQFYCNQIGKYLFYAGLLFLSIVSNYGLMILSLLRNVLACAHGFAKVTLRKSKLAQVALTQVLRLIHAPGWNRREEHSTQSLALTLNLFLHANILATLREPQ